ACFICCMVCHGEVYRLRPDPHELTGFYLMIAFGGALGGVFVGLVAPVIFSDYVELQWGLAMCGLLFVLLVVLDCRSGRLRSWRWKPGWFPDWGVVAWSGPGLIWVAIVVAFWLQVHQQNSMAISKARNFYGVLTVVERTAPTGSKFAKLVHGRTVHGL